MCAFVPREYISPFAVVLSLFLLTIAKTPAVAHELSQIDGLKLSILDPDDSVVAVDVEQQADLTGPTVWELKQNLTEIDYQTALTALNDALNEVPDGVTYFWQRTESSLKGMVKPTRAFRDSHGQICRHIVYALSLGDYIKQIEGIACRNHEGDWLFSS